jgi:hypothetical protein
MACEDIFDGKTTLNFFIFQKQSLNHSVVESEGKLLKSLEGSRRFFEGIMVKFAVH